VDSGGPNEACVRWGAHWRNLAIMTEPSLCGGDAAEPIDLPFGFWTGVGRRKKHKFNRIRQVRSNYFDQLFSFWFGVVD